MYANGLVALLLVVGAAGLVGGVAIGRLVPARRSHEDEGGHERGGERAPDTVPLSDVSAALAVIRAEIAALPELLAWPPQKPHRTTHLSTVRAGSGERAA